MQRIGPILPRRPRLVAGVLLALVAGSLVPPRALGQTADDLADDIAGKRDQAARIAAEVEDLGARASVAVEDYRRAQLRLDEADAELFATRRRVEDMRRRVDDARDDANERIAAMYRGETVPDPVAMLDAKDVRELGVRQHYAGLVARRDRDAVSRLDARREALAGEEDRLEARREEVAVETAALEARRVEVEAVVGERQAALAAAEGELAGLVAEEQRRRQAEEEARARAEAQRRAEQEARRRPVATPSRGGGGAPSDPVANAAPPPVHPRAGEAVDAAMAKLGTPYRWGGNGPDAYDCSGLTSYAWGSVGVRLPRSSWMQKDSLPPVPMGALAPGDLVFFGSPVHHVGIFIGDGKMVNAPFTGSEVRVDSIFRRDYAGAGRPG